MKTTNRIYLLGVLLISLIPISASAQISFLQSIKKQELIQSGKESYNNRCSGCHGLNGDGNTSASSFLDPKPRDFTKGVFKFKSTPIGAMPTNADLLTTINKGIPGTSMPSFDLVSETEKQAIIEYIKTFAKDAWKNQNQEEVIPHLPLPKNVFTNKNEFLQYASRGRAWYQELGCVSCHGTSGQGDGSSAATLQDNWGNPIRPANLTNKTVKRGNTIQDIAYSIMMGVDGTPMPSHSDMLSSLETQFPEIKEKQFIWDLAAYVFYLRGHKADYYTSELKPIPVSGIPADEIKSVIGKYLE